MVVFGVGGAVLVMLALALVVGGVVGLAVLGVVALALAVVTLSLGGKMTAAILRAGFNRSWAWAWSRSGAGSRSWARSGPSSGARPQSWASASAWAWSLAEVK